MKNPAQNTVLVRMSKRDGGLERVMAAVRNADISIQNMAARASVDGSTHYLTLELNAGGSVATLRRNLESVEGVQSVEIDEEHWLGSSPRGSATVSGVERVNFALAYE